MINGRRKVAYAIPDMAGVTPIPCRVKALIFDIANPS